MGQADSAGAKFLNEVRDATVKYRDPARATADGYRPLGPETAAMGQHWVNLRLLVGGRVDPAAPQILQYATVGDTRVLVGVAFGVPLDDEEALPDPPVPGTSWHSHWGTLDDEALNGKHAGMETRAGDRVAVLHVWAWVTNPAGAFEAENWLLPLAVWVRVLGAPPAPAGLPDPSADPRRASP